MFDIDLSCREFSCLIGLWRLWICDLTVGALGEPVQSELIRWSEVGLEAGAESLREFGVVFHRKSVNANANVLLSMGERHLLTFHDQLLVMIQLINLAHLIGGSFAVPSKSIH